MAETREQVHELIRLLGNPKSSTAFYTPKGDIDISEPRRTKARDIAVTELSKQYEGQFKPFYGSELPSWVTTIEGMGAELDPVSSKVSFSSAFRTRLKNSGFSTDDISAMQDRLSQKLGAFRGSGETYVEGLAKQNLPSSLKGPKPIEGSPEEISQRLGQNKSALFAEVAKALQGANTPEDAQAVIRAAFGRAGNADQLFKEFGKWSDEEGQRLLEAERKRQATAGPKGAFGQLMEALDVPADIIQSGIGALSNILPSPDIGPFTSEKVKNAAGEDVGFADVLDALKDVPKAVASVGSLGLTSKIPALNIDRSNEIRFEDLAPILGELQQPGHGPARLAGFAGGFAGNVATDPLSYATFGAGGLGKAAATDILKGTVKGALPDLGEEAAEAAARQVGNVYRGGNFKAAVKAADKLGLDLEELFPSTGFGRQAAARTQVRGGLTLRAGIPGTGAKAAVNVFQGRQAVRTVASSLLDNAGALGEKIRDPFDLATRLSRTGLSPWFKRTFPVESQIVESVQREARGHEHRAVDTVVAASRSAQKKLEPLAKRAGMSEQDLHDALNDLVELGTGGVHYTELVTKVGTRAAQEFIAEANKIAESLQNLRQTALSLGVELPELSAQVAGDLRYLPHGKEYESERLGVLARAGIKPAKVGAAKQRKITVGGGITDPATGVFRPTPKGTLNQINTVNEQIFGTALYNADTFQQVEAYARSMGKAIHGTHVVNRLNEEGLGAELSQQIADRYTNAGVITDPTQARAAYLAPLTEARERVAFTTIARAESARDLQAAARTYARTSKEKLAAIGDLHTLRTASEASSERALVLMRDEAAKRVLFLEARKMQEHEEGIFKAARDAELQDLREAGAIPGVLRATTERYEQWLREVRNDFNRIRDELRTTPEGIRKRLEAHLRSLTPEASAVLRGASGRPYGTVLQDAVDTQKAIVYTETIKRYGRGNLFSVLSDADGTTEFGRMTQRAAQLSQRVGELNRRISNETQAGRHAAATDLTQQRDALQEEAEQLGETLRADPAFADGVQRVASLMDDPDVARFIEEAQSRIPVDDLLAEQRGLAAAGDAKGAAKLSQHIAATRMLGARIEIATKYEEVQQAIRELSKLGLKSDRASGEMVRALKNRLGETLRELDELGRGKRIAVGSKRMHQELQARYLHEQAETSALLQDDWRGVSEKLDVEIANNANLQETVSLTEREITGLVATQKLRASEVRKAREALEQVTVENIDALGKALTMPTIIEATVADLADLGTVVEKLPYADKWAALPEDIALAVRTVANREKAYGSFGKSVSWVTSAIKRGILAIPGSTGRRMFGELIQAHFYAGMPTQYLQKGHNYAAAGRAVHSLDELPSELPYLRGMLEQNILEGKRIEVEAGLEANRRGILPGAPYRKYQDLVFKANSRFEDVLRAGMFVYAKEDLGLSDLGARAFVGKYLFFSDELSELERQYLSNTIMFWNFIRNNTQLQLYMLFHTPGKPAAFQNLQESMGQDVETPFGPTDILAQGGIVTPFRSREGEQEVLYPGLIDIPAGLTAIPDIAELGIGLGQKLTGQPAALSGGNEALMNVNPLLQTLMTLQYNINPATGQSYGERKEPYTPFGVEAGSFTSKQRAVANALLPLLRQFESVSAATPGRKEAVVENLLSQLVGPTVRPITERTQMYESGDIVDMLRALNKGNLATDEEGTPIGIGEVRGKAKGKREQEALDEAIRRILGG